MDIDEKSLINIRFFAMPDWIRQNDEKITTKTPICPNVCGSYPSTGTDWQFVWPGQSIRPVPSP